MEWDGKSSRKLDEREVLLTRIPGGLTPGHGGWLIQCLWVSLVGVGNKVTLWGSATGGSSDIDKRM